MLVPKAPMDKDDLAKPGEDHIRHAGKAADMKPVPKPHTVHQFTNEQLRTGVHAPYSRHSFASLLFGEIIHFGFG